MSKNHKKDAGLPAPSDLPSELPAEMPEAQKPELDEFQQSLKESGFKHPEFFTSPFGKVNPAEKQRVLSKIEQLLKEGKPVKVVATKDTGDYPSRVRRSLGEEFKIKAVQDFSFNWMKLVE